MRVFLATGEASGDMLGAALANAIRTLVPDVTFAGVGSERMAAAGVTLKARTTGWGAMGPLEAARTIPTLLFTWLRLVASFRRSPWDVIVMIDFGAAHVRVAKMLRWIGYRGPIVYLLPPGVFLDLEGQARAVARLAIPLTAFAHQRDFYRSLGLEIAYFGHPLGSLVEPREPRPPAPPAGGVVAILPGSRRAELGHHLPVLFAAARMLRERRPEVTFVVSAADAEAEKTILRHLARDPLPDVRVVRGSRAALDVADAAWIASGTAVLEAALREVPCAALYVVSPAQVAIGRRMYAGKYITLPNILLDREIVTESLQEDATPERLTDAVDALLTDPAEQLHDLRAVRAELGEPDALQRCAAFAVAAARMAGGRA
jgi:lipid-A-disaccharide synthase